MVLIKGGPANSGTKQAKRPAVKQPWRCLNCNTLNAPHWVNCPTVGCREKRALR